jgi:uncharacterized phage-associated protein
MNPKPYFQLSSDQMDKVGNSMIFLSEKISDISKTKMLKLLYLLDEFSIKNSGIPFFNLQYKAWKLGPVAEEIFVELSDKPLRLGKYIEVKNIEDKAYIVPVAEFCDNEFSDNDIKLIEKIAVQFENTTAKELVEYTHRPNSPWRIATEAMGVYDLLEQGHINNTEIIIDMSSLVSHDERKKNIFALYMEEK